MCALRGPGLLLLFALGGATAPACTGSIGEGAAADARVGAGDADPRLPDARVSEDAGPLFQCWAAGTTSPRLAGILTYDPADPHPGDTLTVIVRATNGTGRADAPAMELDAEGAGGVSVHAPLTIEGGAAIYYFAVPGLQLGDLCLLGSIDGQPEISGKVTVTPRPPGPPITAGVFKVVSNHQWTCAEQPDWGNYVEIRVLDENGQGLPGVDVRVAMPATTVPPIYNDEGNIPELVTTGASGVFTGQNYWPVNENGLQVFALSVDGQPSDVATEVTTGWWEDDLRGCNYCNRATVNVWGHWSYSVVFQRVLDATATCVVENDHAGMAACGAPRHIHHHPTERACW